MTAEIPRTPETLSDLAGVLAELEDVLAVDVCSDPDGLDHAWLELWADSLVVPQAVLSELVRGPFAISEVDHRHQHTRVIVLELER